MHSVVVDAAERGPAADRASGGGRPKGGALHPRQTVRPAGKADGE